MASVVKRGADGNSLAVMGMDRLSALRALVLIAALASPYFEPFHGPACAPGTGPAAICPGD